MKIKYPYNLHSHTFLSDGQLLPSEVAVRYMDAGYKIIAITDHVDYSNIIFVTKAVLGFCARWPKNSAIKVLPGVELTHLPPGQFNPLVSYARKQGIKIIIAHGQTPVEPVIENTNRMAILAGIDILAHPGLISEEDASLAKKRGVFLEVTSRQGHANANKHVIKQARKFRAKLILNNDSHSPKDIIAPQELINVGLRAGLSEEELEGICRDLEAFLKQKEAG